MWDLSNLFTKGRIMSIYKETNESNVNAEPILLDKHQTAKTLSISVSSLERLMKSAEIPFVRLNGRVLFPRRKLEAWAQGLPHGATQ